MSCRKLALAGIAALSVALSVILSVMAGLTPAQAASLAAVAAWRASPSEPLFHPILFGHFRHSASAYCYPRNYWWFYRPYTTADEGYARCMPYFHYPPQAFDRRRSGSEPPPK
jgi:hypothetical protein